MKLYTYYRSSAAFRVRIALNYKGIAYESLAVNLAKAGQRAAEYTAVNAQGLVPTLDDGGRILTQSLAIIEYLDETQAGPKLLPAEPPARAYVRALSQIVACEIHPLNNTRTLKYLRKTCGLDEEGINAWYRHWIAEGLTMVEAFLTANNKHGTYCYRDQVSMADCCLVPQIFNAQRYQCELAAYPTLMRIHEACMLLDAFIDAQPDRQSDAVA